MRGPIFVRLLSSSSRSRTSLGSSSPAYWTSVSPTKASGWISQQFWRTSFHSISGREDIRTRYAGGLPPCANGVQSPSRNCRQVESSSNGSRNGTLPREHRAELSNKEEWAGLQKWRTGGGFVHKLAKVDDSVVVEMGAIIHAHAIIGPHTRISSGSIVGSHVVVGSDTKLGYNVALQNCSVGDSCMLHSGVCVGQDGFGFTVNDKGEMVKKPQMLRVQIGNNVEIGANSCIDRGSWRDTIIGDHTKIDNLVQIGHNVVIGRFCILCGQVGIAGSATLGDYVVMGGKSGVADHVSVASKVRIAAMSAVASNIIEPGDYAGFPAVPAKVWRQSVLNFRKLGKQSQVGTDAHFS
ncbi:unnamed protein product [Calypogeia fissa]